MCWAVDLAVQCSPLPAILRTSNLPWTRSVLRLGNLVISSSRDGTVKFWDTLSGMLHRTARHDSTSSQMRSTLIYQLFFIIPSRSGHCVKTIVPTLLVGKNSAHVSINNGPSYKGKPLALQDKQSASFFVCSSASSPSVDYTGGEVSEVTLLRPFP